jgi:hypothetical protein
MNIQDLWSQGGFCVFKKGGEGLDVVYSTLPSFPEGKIKARQRIESVEIETAINEVDCARITFYDPERVWSKYIAELYKGGDAKLEIWTVKIGYHFAPESTWATFSGVPMLETVDFPRNEPPRVTIRLFSPSIVLQRHNSSLQGAKSRHWLFGPDEPPSVKRALEEMASYYGLQLDLGTTVAKVIDILDEHFKYYFDQTTRYLREEWAHGPTWPWEHVLFVQDVDYIIAMRKIAFDYRNPGRARDTSDWTYLDMIKRAIQPIVQKMNEGEKTAGVNDKFWTVVSKAGNMVVFGVSDNKLFLKTLRDCIDDIDEVVVFSYQTGDHSLLEFSSAGALQSGGVDIAELVSPLFGKRQGMEVEVKTDETLTNVQGGGDNPEMRYRVSGADRREGDNYRLTKDGYFRVALSGSRREWIEAAAEQVLGFLNCNITARATLMGAPFLRAGKLMGTYGLSPVPDTTPEPGRKTTIYSMDRIWFITRCTHRVGPDGFYITEVELAGAMSDDSSQKIQKMEKQLQAMLAEAAGMTKSFWQKLLELGIQGLQYGW